MINEDLLNFYYKIVYNLTRIKRLFRPIKLIRNFGNKLGLAWWAKIETQQPNTTYWYGPFITKRSLKQNMSSFIKDLTNEGSKNIKHNIVRCKKEEPLTV
tara:strand:- start:171 stop:470 length:300 start_codon:yes stop_codon:yes gene_type:complete